MRTARRPWGATGRWAATLVALVLGVLPNVPGFLKSSGMVKGEPDVFDAIYPYAWFIGVAIAGGLYLVGTRMRAKDAAPA